LIRTLLHAMSTVPHLNPFRPYGPRAVIGIDRTRGEALDLPEDDATKGGAATINGVVIQWAARTLYAPILRRGGEVVIPPDWEKSARIGVLYEHEQERTIFSRTVRVGRFELAP
jgi:hypothetical protein